MLGLAVAELVLQVRGARRDADGEIGEERSREVGAGMRRLRQEPEAVRREPDAQLEQDQHRGRGDGQER